MHNGYDDILAIAHRFNTLTGRLVKDIVPLWWDENGVPRFAEHHPKLCPDIYADQVILLRISCQACVREFEVQMSCRRYGRLPVCTKCQEPSPTPTLQWFIETCKPGGTMIAPHYGDPPSHDCPTGETMNCWDLKVMEFWRRPTDRKSAHDWERVPKLEIDLPDLTDLERVHGVPCHPCPKCKKLVPDFDGFGVLAHVAPMEDACGYCTHPSAERIDDKHMSCGICSAVIEC